MPVEADCRHALVTVIEHVNLPQRGSERFVITCRAKVELTSKGAKSITMPPLQAVTMSIFPDTRTIHKPLQLCKKKHARPGGAA